jgi:hypothetical protein
VGVVLLLVLGSGYVATKLFRAVGHSLTGLSGAGTASAPRGGARAGSGGPLQQAGSPIDLSGEGARAVGAGNNVVYYSMTGAGKTVVHAVDPGTGKDKWAQTLAFEPAKASIHTVGDLVVLDGAGSATDGGRDIRVVLRASDGTMLHKLDWSRRADVAYLGTDAIAATTTNPYQTMRVNLRTGQTTWKSTPIASIIAYHPVNPELTWVAKAAGVVAPDKSFTESFGVNPDRFVQVDGDAGTAQVVNGAGKTTANARVDIDDEILKRTWFAFDGLLIGALTDRASPGRAAIGGYRLDGLRKAWDPVGLNAGDEIQYLHPCGEHLVCVVYESGGLKKMFAFDARNGNRITWATPPPYGDSATDPYWLVLGGQMLYGDGTFPPNLGCGGTGLLILDPLTGATHRALVEPTTKACAPQVAAGGGRYLAVRDLSVAIPSGKISWQVALIDVMTGKRTGPLDLGTGETPPTDVVAVSGTTVAAVGSDRKLRIGRAPRLS